MAKESVTVNIMDRQFTVGCKKQEREDLLNAAAYLDDQLRSVQAQSKVVGLEHCVVIAALNLTNELLKLRRHPQAPEALLERIRTLRERVQNVVSGTPSVASPELARSVRLLLASPAVFDWFLNPLEPK